MLREIRELGFEWVELGHGTRISLVPGILEAVEAGEMNISSLHNFCPLPMGVTNAAPNIYRFSSPLPRERELALKHTLKTIEFAQRLKAQAVVLHLGSIEMKDYTDKLLEKVQRGERDTPKYDKLCSEFVEAREAKKEAFVERTNEILRKIAPEAESRGIRLGAESRQGLTELPLEADFRFLFRDVASAALGYWHDTGHAQIKENLGFIRHAMHLESLCDRLIGFHIHDVQFPGRDHCEPGTGTIDFAALKPFVKPEHLKIFELGPSLKAEEILRGVKHLKAIWGE
jgi:sugar phosphate isomerase/epimerase